ncbi:MAG: glycosyltransferase [Myxococcaceae bacterium]
MSGAPLTSKLLPMRVLHVLGNVGMTGVETFVLTLTAAQRRRGDGVYLACAEDGRRELLDAAQALGVKTTLFLSRGEQRHWVGKALSFKARWQRWRLLVRVLRDAKPDVLHVHAVGIDGLESFLAALWTRTRFVVTHHATLSFFAPLRNFLSDVTLWLERHFAHAVVAPYSAAAGEWQEAGVPARRLHTIPFCVDIDRFAPTGRPPDDEVTTFHLWMPARLVEGKGHKELIEATAQLRPKYPRLRLTLAGAGPLEEDIRAHVERLGLGAVVSVGYVPHEEMPARMAKAHAVVLPSRMRGETFPIAMLEAMALGLPSVGTRWFGIPEIVVDGETGLLIPSGDVAALVNALQRLVADSNLVRRMGEAARRRAVEKFSARAISERYAALYRD